MDIKSSFFSQIISSTLKWLCLWWSPAYNK